MQFQYIWLWLKFSILYAWRDTFGWSGAGATVIVALIAKYFNYLPSWITFLFKNQSPIQGALETLAISLILAFLINAVISAPFRVWKEIKPLKISVKNNSSSPTTLTSTNKQKISVRISTENRSVLKSLNCKVSILEIKGDKNRPLPWPIKAITIPPRTEYLVDIAYLFFGGTDAYIQILADKTSMFSEASVMLFRPGTTDLLIGVDSDDESKKLWCRIWTTPKGQLHMREL